MTYVAIRAQNQTKPVDVTIGPIVKGGYDDFRDIIGYDEEGIYILKKKGILRKYDITTYHIEKYNHDLEFVQSEKVEFSSKNYRRDFELTIKNGKDVFLFASANNIKAKRLELYHYKINYKTLRIEPNPIMVAHLGYQNRLKSEKGNFEQIVSKKGSKMAIYGRRIIKDKLDVKLDVFVFDSLMNPVWQKEITLPYEGGDFEIVECMVDEEGNFFVLGRISLNANSKRSKSKTSYQHFLHSYTKNGKVDNILKLEIAGKFFQTMAIEMNPNSELICVGMYAENEEKDVEGLYIFTINTDNLEIASTINSDLNKELLKNVKNYGKKSFRFNLRNYQLREFIWTADGNMWIVGERRNAYVNTYANSSISRDPEWIYMYDYLMVFCLNPSGEIIWVSEMRKNQEASIEGYPYMSYKLMVTDNNGYFIFNEYHKNMAKKTPKYFYPYSLHKKCVIALGTIDMQGSQGLKPLLSEEEKSTMFYLQNGIQVDQNTFITFSKHGYSKTPNKLRFFKLQFK